MTQDAPGFLSRELARKTAELVRAQGNGSGNMGLPVRGGNPPPTLASAANLIIVGDYGTALLVGSDQQIDVYARHKSVYQGETSLIAWTAGNEISTIRGDSPVVRGQWEFVAATEPDNSGLPVATPPGTCGCNNCWPGVPLPEEDTFSGTCGCVNRVRVGVHSPLTVRFPGGERIEWGASGGKHVYSYQGEGIWKTRLFDAPFCDEEETLADRYYYELDANTKIVSLEIDGDPEEADCPVIKATWCFADGCAFSCLCPWIFKRYQPFKYAESPESCNLCITPVRQVVGQFCDPVGCELTPLYAVTIPEFSFGVSTQVGHTGDMDVALAGYQGQTTWPREIELPACASDAPIDFVSLSNREDSTVTVLVPFQEASGTAIRYAAILTDAQCPDGNIAQIYITLSCGFNEEDQREITANVDIYFYASVVGGTVGAQNGCMYARYSGTKLLSNICTESTAVDRYFLDYNSVPLGIACGDDNLITGDAQAPTRLYVQPYSPTPPNNSGEDAADCGGEPFDPLPGGDCANENCVLEVQVIGEGLGKRWVQNVEDTTCEECGSCYAECNGIQDGVCGDANDYPDGYKCIRSCKEEGAGSDTVTVTFDYDGSGACTCGETTAVLCITDEGLYEGTVTLCDQAFTFSYYEDGGTWHLDGGPVNATSANPAGPFDIAGPSDLVGCDGLNNVTVS